MLMLLFEAFIAGHILFGAIGLVSFWVPVVGRKGGERHRLWGKIFAICLLITGCFAIGMSLCTLADPLGTHPKLQDAAFVRVIFGIMMLYLAILTVNLAWYGFEAVRHKRDHLKNRGLLNVALQPILIIAAAVCAFEGWQSGQSLMIGMSIIGFATAGTNLMFMYNPKPGPKDWLKEHIKALVGAGISVYTAFFAFGAVRLMPELALQPALWAVPLVVGLSIILYHQFKIRQSMAGAGRGRGAMVSSER